MEKRKTDKRKMEKREMEKGKMVKRKKKREKKKGKRKKGKWKKGKRKKGKWEKRKRKKEKKPCCIRDTSRSCGTSHDNDNNSNNLTALMVVGQQIPCLQWSHPARAETNGQLQLSGL